MPRHFAPGRERALTGKIKPLTIPERNMIKRKLNIPVRAPFPKCPSKNNSALRRLEAAGDTIHRDRKHAPCEKCTCQNVAGLGTSHYGYGWCYLHEIGQSNMQCAQMAEADLRAHQQRHPRAFRDVQQYLAKTEIDGEKCKNAFDLTKEMQTARELVRSLYERMSAYERDKDATLAIIVTEMQALRASLDANQWLDQNDKDAMSQKLDGLFDKLVCPLTEKGAGGPVEMSDATRIKLQMESSEQLSRISERVQKLLSMNMISRESFKVWLGDFYGRIKKEFGIITYDKGQNSDGVKVVRMILEGIGECMRATGEPRRGI